MHISDFYFERENEKATFLYPELDLSQMDIFKVVCDSQLVEEEEVSPMRSPSCLLIRESKLILREIRLLHSKIQRRILLSSRLPQSKCSPRMIVVKHMDLS